MSFKAQSIIKALASLKLAVFIIIVIGVLSAWGTIVEARYNSEIATKIVYHSVWMVGTLSLLTINLIAVIIDRYPWKRHHLGFILAHIGIIVLLIGSVVTQKLGVDGSMRVALGKSGRHVMVPETDVIVWSSFNGSEFAKVFEQQVDFFLDPPNKKKPVDIPLPDAKLQVVDYMPFAIEERKIVASVNPELGPALRFQLQNENVNVSQWLRMDSSKGAPSVMNFGPARVVLNRGNYRPTGDNEIILKSDQETGKLSYQIHSKRKELPVKRGMLGSGDSIDTGWMGMQFRALKYLPHAEEEVKFSPLDRPTDITRAAIKILFDDEPYWFSLNSLLKLFTDKAVYVISYANRRLDVGFDLKLVDFRVGRYQGTMRASTYDSDVDVPGVGKVNITMNEPLKFKNYTFYQSSFSEDPETGKPTHSVFSVNRDPGRWIKYLGSLLMVLGTIVMFYFKRAFAKQRKKA